MLPGAFRDEERALSLPEKEMEAILHLCPQAPEAHTSAGLEDPGWEIRTRGQFALTTISPHHRKKAGPGLPMGLWTGV